ncbi:MAG: IspD/TarI family cytidylyltransferase [Candidatus Nanopelagicales bacterium]
MSSVHVIIEVNSPLAFLPLGETSVCATAVKRAQESKSAPSISIFVAPEIRDQWNRLDAKLKPLVDVESASTLFDAVSKLSTTYVLIHESLRPLTLPKTFDEVVNALQSGAEAARPAHAVVDTLKTVTDDFVVSSTINRDLMQSLTSPEGYVRERIIGTDDVWHFQVQNPEKRHFVRGDQESIKIRQKEDVVLVESFLAWQTITKN